jgi:radical SAM superfamily enzyme YgiQ (UPF0313 family)
MIKRKLNKAWLAQVSINFADDEETLFYAAKSGCVGVLVGFESVSEETLEGMNKNLNLRYGVDYYRRMVKKLHRFGIAVNGQIILGNDGDRPETFEQTVDFINKAAIDIPNIPLLVPYPGTKLFKRLHSQGRLLYTDFPGDWQFYSGQKLLYGPANLTKQQVEEGYRYVLRNLFSFRKRLVRVIRSAPHVRDWRLLLGIWIFNLSIHETYSKKALVKGF